MSAIEDFVAERRAHPWPWEYSPSDGEVNGKAVYERYRAWMEERGDKPLSHVDFGVALQAVPGITRRRIPAGNVYSGLTVESRQERAYNAVHTTLLSAEIHARADQPWVQRKEAHRQKHVKTMIATGTWSQCDHPEPPDVVAGLAEVEAAIAPAFPLAVEAEYGPWLHYRPEGPNPGLVAMLTALQADGRNDRPVEELKHLLRQTGEYVNTPDEQRLIDQWAAFTGTYGNPPTADDEDGAFADY